MAGSTRRSSKHPARRVINRTAGSAICLAEDALIRAASRGTMRTEPGIRCRAVILETRALEGAALPVLERCVAPMGLWFF